MAYYNNTAWFFQELEAAECRSQQRHFAEAAGSNSNQIVGSRFTAYFTEISRWYRNMKYSRILCASSIFGYDFELGFFSWYFYTKLDLNL